MIWLLLLAAGAEKGLGVGRALVFRGDSAARSRSDRRRCSSLGMQAVRLCTSWRHMPAAKGPVCN